MKEGIPKFYFGIFDSPQSRENFGGNAKAQSSLCVLALDLPLTHFVASDVSARV